MNNYIEEAAKLKPVNCTMAVYSGGILVEMVIHRGIFQKTVSWDEIRQCRVNPIMAAIEGMGKS